VRALKPARRHFSYGPAEPGTLHKQLDAVAEAAVELDCDFIQRAARETAKAIAGLMRRHSSDAVEREVAGTHRKALSHGQSTMLPPGMNRLAQTISHPFAASVTIASSIPAL